MHAMELYIIFFDGMRGRLKDPVIMDMMCNKLYSNIRRIQSKLYGQQSGASPNAVGLLFVICHLAAESEIHIVM